MALTDAVSVACKALGFGAAIYAKKDRSKYNGWQPQDSRKQQSNKDQVTEAQKQAIRTQIKKLGMKEEVLLQSIKAKSLDSLTKQQASDLITKLDMQLKKGA